MAVPDREKGLPREEIRGNYCKYFNIFSLPQRYPMGWKKNSI
jgi:hypothetical protein